MFWATFNLNFSMAEYLDMEDENLLEVILSNLFRKESNSDLIDFFLRRTAIHRQNNVEHDGKFKKLKEQIEVLKLNLETNHGSIQNNTRFHTKTEMWWTSQ